MSRNDPVIGRETRRYPTSNRVKPTVTLRLPDVVHRVISRVKSETVTRDTSADAFMTSIAMLPNGGSMIGRDWGRTTRHIVSARDRPRSCVAWICVSGID